MTDIRILQEHFDRFANAESARFRNLGAITKQDNHYYLDSNGKITRDVNKIALDIYYIKASNMFVTDIIMNGEVKKAVFCREMPKSGLDRSKYLK